jgi:hypothetical protein
MTEIFDPRHPKRIARLGAGWMGSTGIIDAGDPPEPELKTKFTGAAGDKYAICECCELHFEDHSPDGLWCPE